ncbi:MAG: winged helix-turn-helix domain-containing protein [Betaproteobacteria bacterium]
MIYRFADCELDTERFELRRAGTAQKVEPQVYEVLRYLVERHGRFVSKDELHTAIWQGRVVSDAAMSSRIKAARRAIGDTGDDQRLIRTVHGRGFSFVAPVTAAGHDTAPLEPPPEASAPHTRATAGDNTESGEVLLSADVHLNEFLNGESPVAATEAELLSERGMLVTELEKLGGRVIAHAAGGVAARFDTAVAALKCAAGLLSSQPMARSPGGVAARPRIGISELGDDLKKAIGIAARLQCWSAPGEICITGHVGNSAHHGVEFSRRPIDGGPGHELNELSLYIVEAGNPASKPPRAGIPQLQCGSSAQPREPSIVLLPFDALGNDELAAELAEGLRIDIQNALVKIARIRLIAAASANAFRGKSPELAAESLGVRYVLHGVVQMVESRARVFVELVDTLSARVIWAEQFTIVVSDSFTVQDEITRKVITALDIKLYSGEQARIWHQALADPDAVRLFYRGVRLFFRMERERMVEAQRAFEALSGMRPDSSIGPTWVALCHWVGYMRRWSGSQSESKQLAKRWGEAAAALQDADGQAHTVLAHVRLLDREFDAALDAGRNALLLRPGCANANGFFGNVLHFCGQQAEAIAHLRKGIRLQPVYPPFFASILAAAYLIGGHTDPAMVVAKEGLRLNPRDLQSRLVLVAANQLAGHQELATTFGREILRLEPDFSVGKHYGDQPYRDNKIVETQVEACRAAGLPA